MPLDEHMGLDIARSLGKQGIPVYGIDPDPYAPGGKSKYCQLVACPDPKESEQDYLQFLVDWGKKLKSKAVLYPLSDDMALLCSRERQTLQTYYEYVMPDHPTMVKLSSKGGLPTAAQECDISAPQTIIPHNGQEVETIAQRLTYPVVLKPIESAYWHTPEIASLLRENPLSGRAKVMLCHNASELVQAYGNIATYDDRMIIQEMIPGPDENLGYVSFYLDRQSKPLAIFAGRKLRVLPIGFGSASYVRSFHDPDLERVALQLLSGVRYQGLGGVEFKKDPRDGQYKLVEFNTRFGMWDGLGVRCGVDTPYIAYRDTLHLAVEPQLTYREDVIWVDWQRDIRAFWMYNKQGQLTLGQWLRSLRGEKMWAIYCRDDWRPGVTFSSHLLRLLWTRITSR
jgi:predicted ATP-grasp superfamily ATP-dependent carboligase